MIKIGKLKKHQEIFIFSIISVAIIAVLDILAMKSNLFGTVLEYTNGSFGCDWWYLFSKIGFILISIPAVIYFFFVKKDFSESISFIISSVIIWFTGLADIMYFIFQGLAIPSTLSWLDKGVIIGFISTNIFKSPVTNVTLFFTAFVGLIIAYFTTKILVEKL
jgi:hypothetical protein